MVGGHRSAAWSLMEHGGGITALPQTPLNVGAQHFAGAGPGLAHARMITHGLLDGLLSSSRAQRGCTGPGYERACQQHAYVQGAAMAHMSPPPAVFHIKITPCSSLRRDQPELRSAVPNLGQRSRGLLPAEGRHTSSPAPK